MMMYRKNRIGFRLLLMAILFSFASFNVNYTYATQKSVYGAEQELIKQKNENKTKVNTSKNANNNSKIKKVESKEKDETIDKKPSIGGYAGPHEMMPNYAGKNRVLVPTGGGGMGEGGGAAKNVGGTAGKSIDFSNDANLNQEVVSNTVPDSDGKDLISETMGFAEDDGQFYKENEGDHAGTKIFELDRNGSIGFDEDHISVANIKGFMSFFLFAAFGLGGLSFFMATRDIRSKNNYF